MPNIVCVQCGKEFYISPSRIGRTKCCSKECSSAYRLGKPVEAKRQRIKINCSFCGVEIEKRPCEIRDNNYCSKQCSDKGKMNVVEVHCSTCGKSLLRSPSRIVNEKCYCDDECYKQSKPDSRVVVYCETCGKKLLRYPCYAKGRNFCSRKCRGLSVPTGPDNPLWVGGIAGGKSGAWRKNVLRSHDYKCALCGATSNLHTHHIKKFSDVPELARDKDNGICLCAKCHMGIHRENKHPVIQTKLKFFG